VARSAAPAGRVKRLVELLLQIVADFD